MLARGGELIELRGDEALCVFTSARQAVRTAVDLQFAFRRTTEDGPVFRLPIGIGLDAGEAVPVEGGYRGGALNTAARLCSLAVPGQVLATDTVVSLSRRLDGIRFVPKKPVRLKGLEEPVRPIEIVPEGGFPVLPELAARRRPASRRRMVVASAATAAVLVAAVVLAVLSLGGSEGLSTVQPNALGKIDGGGIAAQVELDSAPTAVAAGGGSLWAASESKGTLARVDPETGDVSSATVGGSPAGVAQGENWVWVTQGRNRALLQIEPKSLATNQTITVGNGPGAVAVGEGAVWVVNEIDGTVTRFGLGSGQVTDTIPVGPDPSGITVAGDAVWVASEAGGTVLRIDPGTRKVTDSIPVGHGPTAIAAGPTGVWVANSQDGTVARIDPATAALKATVDVGGRPSAVAVDENDVWVGDSGTGNVTRIDPKTPRVADTFQLGSSPSGLATSDGKLWASTLPPLAGHRGGVLRVEGTPLLPPQSVSCRCVDPVLGGDAVDFAAANLVYDGLVAYRRVGGTAGDRLLPNLATRLPAPADDGKTYTLELRPGLVFSTGAPVRPSDVRSSIERDLTLNQYTALRGILGAKRCLAHPGKPCGLGHGIQADDAARTVTFRLADSDPEFLYKLALTEASVVPKGTPLHPPAAGPPGTGPYAVAVFDPKGVVRLKRNERFRVWSVDARPDGYPDEIRLHASPDAKAKLAAVEQGKSDWVSLRDASLSQPQQRGLITRHADRIHSEPSAAVLWLFLNTKEPPFDDKRVRQALNYAIDRDETVRLGGGVGTTTCQHIPPNFPGYRPYCPYTRSPNAAGTWTGPDLAKARKLVAASGTKGMKVVVPLRTDLPAARNIGEYVAGLLRELGYRASTRPFPAGVDPLAYEADSRNHLQLGTTGWFADMLAASNFLRPLFSCKAFIPNNPVNSNWFRFCNKELDERMAEATRLQASDPAKADELWAAIDHDLVDEAPAVPYINPGDRAFVSKRVGNYQSHPLWGTLFDQLWVK